MKKDNHKNKCKVCNSEVCKEIEERFLAWESPEKLEEIYKPTHNLCVDNIRTHCRHFGLDKKRKGDMKGVCVAIIEKGMKTLKNVGARDVVGAAKLHATMSGKLVNKVEHSGEIININVQKEADKQCKNLKDRMGMGKNSKDTPDLDNFDEEGEDETT